MPGMPASPMNSAYSDQPKAASTPTEISVSIVAVACLRFAHAARWNGSAPQTTTGAASVSDSHCQLSNCSGGIIAIASTGSISASEIEQAPPQRRGLVLAARRRRLRLRQRRAA